MFLYHLLCFSVNLQIWISRYSFPSWRGFKINLTKWRATRDNYIYSLLKTLWRKNLFSRITAPISSNFVTRFPVVKINQVCSNKRSWPFPRGENNDIVWNKFIPFENLPPHNLTKHDTDHHWVTGVHYFYTNEGS